MLHNEAQNLLVQAYEQTHDAQTVAKYFQVSTSTAYRLSGQMTKTGSVDLQTSRRGRKAALTEENLHEIDQLIMVQPDITIDEIVETLGYRLVTKTMRKVAIWLVYVYVKGVRTILQETGMKLLYLPAYNPDLNPIEDMLSKIKAFLRKLKIRSLSLLRQGIAIGHISGNYI